MKKGLLTLLHTNGEIYYVEGVPEEDGDWVVRRLINGIDPDEIPNDFTDEYGNTNFYGLGYENIVAADWKANKPRGKTFLSKGAGIVE